MTNWWQYATSLLYGQTDSGKGGVENGVDFQTPFHTPITVLQGLGGTITGINKDPWGGTITVQSNTAVGNLLGLPSVFSYYTHLDTFASGLHVGSVVNPGDLLGLSGGQVTGGNMPSGSYSTGPHTEFGFTAGPAFGHGSSFQAGPNVLSEFNPIPYLNNTLGLGIKDTQPEQSPTVGDALSTVGNSIASNISNGIANAFKSIFSADIVQRSIIVILSLILIVIGVVVLFKQGTNVQKTEVAS